MAGRQELKDEVAAFKRRRILEEAAHLFFLSGYEGTTLDEVAQRLHVTKPYLYSCFQNKAEILYDICEAGIRHALDALDASLASPGSASSRLDAVVRQVASIVIEKREYVIVYQREEKNLSKTDARHIRELRKHFDHQLALLLAEGCDGGEFDCVADRSLTATTISGIISWLPSWYVPGGRLTKDQVIEETLLIIRRIVLARKRREK